jgi:hypothetical protein
MIGAPGQGRGRDHQKALGAGHPRVALELLRRYVTLDRVMARRRLQILADGEEVDAGRAHVVHHLMDLALLLAQSDHDPGLREQTGITHLDAVEQTQRVVIASARPHRAIEPRHGLEIVIVDVRPGVDDLLERARLAQEIGGQNLDRGLGRGASDRLDAAHELEGATVRKVVPVDRGDHDVLEAELTQRLGEVLGFVRIDGAGQPGLDVAEGAGAGADIAQDHHGGVPLGPALADVGAGRLLADRVQPLRPHQAPGRVIAFGDRRFDPDPGRFATDAAAGLIKDGAHGGSARSCIADALSSS